MKFVTSRILEKDQGNIVVHGNTWIGHRSMKLRTGLVFFFFFFAVDTFLRTKTELFPSFFQQKVLPIP